MTERDCILVALVAMRDLERKLGVAPDPFIAPAWQIFVRQVGEWSGARVTELLDDPWGDARAASRRAIHGLEQRLAEIVDDERWEHAS